MPSSNTLSTRTPDQSLLCAVRAHSLPLAAVDDREMAGRKRARVQRSSSSSSSSSPQQEEKSLAQPSLRSRGAAASVSASTYSPPSLAAASRAASALLSSSTTSSSSSSSSSAAAAAAEAESEMKAVWKAEAKAEAETAPSSSSLLSSDFLSESSGYVKDAFVDAVDSDWICPVCAAVCRDAETSICCQRLACRRCVISWFVVNAGRSCPLCGISPCSRAGFLPAPYIDRRVRSLTIRCPQGCATRGLVIGLKEQTLLQHLKEGCSRRRILCPNRCRVSYAAQDEQQHQQRDCLNQPVRCQYNCGERINPSDAYIHFAHCGMNRAPCPLVCFETAEQRDTARKLPVSARRYYSDSSGSGSAVTVEAATFLFDVLDSDKDWVVARAKEIKDGRVLVHYEHWSDTWDEWLPVDSDRIAPLNTHTPFTWPPDGYNRSTRAWLAAHRPASDHPPDPSFFFPSSPLHSSSSSLTRSLIQVAAVDQHLAAVCPNRPQAAAQRAATT